MSYSNTNQDKPLPSINTNSSFCDKVSIVTGAIRGIGRNIAVEMAKCGYSLVLPIYDWFEEIDKLKEALQEACAKFLIIGADLRDKDCVSMVVKTAVKEYGRVDVLINNIERGGWPIVHGAYTEEQWRLEWETTVNAKWHLFRECLLYLRDTKGCVVNITSIAGIVGRWGPASIVFNECYAASNKAVSLFTTQWAREGAPQVRVNELQLGFIETRHGPLTRGWGLLRDEDREAIERHTLLRRTGTVDDVSKAVLFLVKDAPFLTGATIRLDGGYVLGGEYVADMPEGIVTEDESTYGGILAPMRNKLEV